MENKNFIIKPKTILSKKPLAKTLPDKKTQNELVISKVDEKLKKSISDEDKEKSDFTLRYAMDFYLQRKDIDTSIKIIKKALDINPNNENAYYNLGVLFSEKNEHNASIDAFNNCIKINSKNESARFNLANQYIKIKNFDLAISEYQTILQSNPSAQDTLYNIAFCYLTFLEDYDKAIQYFNLLLNYNSIHTDAMFNLAVSHYKNGNKEKAIELYNEITLLFPEYAIAYYNLGNLYYELGRKDKAIVAIEKYLHTPKEVSEYNYVKLARRRVKEWKDE